MNTSPTPRTRRTIAVGAGLAAIFTTAVLTATPAAATTTGPLNPTTVTLQDGSTLTSAGAQIEAAVDSEVVRLLNIERENLGRAPLTVFPGLSWAAGTWSNHIAIWGPGDGTDPVAQSRANFTHDYTERLVSNASVGCHLLIPAPWGSNSSGGGGETVVTDAMQPASRTAWGSNWATDVAQGIVQDYKNSPEHWAILTSSDVNYIGSGTVTELNPYDSEQLNNLGLFFYNTIRVTTNCRTNLPVSASNSVNNGATITYVDGGDLGLPDQNGYVVQQGRPVTVTTGMQVEGWDSPMVTHRDFHGWFTPSDGGPVVDLGMVTGYRQAGTGVNDGTSPGDNNSGLYVATYTTTPTKPGTLWFTYAGQTVNDFLTVGDMTTPTVVGGASFRFASTGGTGGGSGGGSGGGGSGGSSGPITGAGSVVNPPAPVVAGQSVNLNLRLSLPGASAGYRAVAVMFTPAGGSTMQWTSAQLYSTGDGVFNGSISVAPPGAGTWSFLYGGGVVSGQTENPVSWSVSVPFAAGSAGGSGGSGKTQDTSMVTTLSGFSGGTVRAHAKKVKRTVRITPGVGRVVKVQRCASHGHCKWVVFKTLHTNAKGVVKVVLPATKAGVRYRLVVTAHGVALARTSAVVTVKKV